MEPFRFCFLNLQEGFEPHDILLVLLCGHCRMSQGRSRRGRVFYGQLAKKERKPKTRKKGPGIRTVWNSIPPCPGVSWENHLKSDSRCCELGALTVVTSWSSLGVRVGLSALGHCHISWTSADLGRRWHAGKKEALSFAKKIVFESQPCLLASKTRSLQSFPYLHSTSTLICLIFIFKLSVF